MSEQFEPLEHLVTATPCQIMGDEYERLRDNRWRRLDGRVVLVLDLQDSDFGELPWRVMADGEYVMNRFSHPWNAIRAALRVIAGRVTQ